MFLVHLASFNAGRTFTTADLTVAVDQATEFLSSGITGHPTMIRGDIFNLATNELIVTTTHLTHDYYAFSATGPEGDKLLQAAGYDYIEADFDATLAEVSIQNLA